MMPDHLVNRLVYWSSDHPWRMVQVLVLLITAPCWLEKLL